MDRLEFARLIATACAAYLTELPEETVEIYWRALESTPYDDAAHRLKKHIERERYFPRIAELRKQEPAGVRFYGTPVDPSKLLTGPKADPERAARVIAKIRETLHHMTPAPEVRLPRPALPTQVMGACTCELGSRERCDYCRLWSATYG